MTSAGNCFSFLFFHSSLTSDGLKANGAQNSQQAIAGGRGQAAFVISVNQHPSRPGGGGSGSGSESAAGPDKYLSRRLDTNNSREGPEVPEDIGAARRPFQKVAPCVLEARPDPPSATWISQVCPLGRKTLLIGFS